MQLESPSHQQNKSKAGSRYHITALHFLVTTAALTCLPNHCTTAEDSHLHADFKITICFGPSPRVFFSQSLNQAYDLQQ